MSETSNNAYHNILTKPEVEPSGCPVNHEFTTFNDDYLANPYPQLTKIREEHPVFYSKQLGFLVVTRMEDVTEIFRDHDVYSSKNVQDPVFPICKKAAAVLAAEDFNPVAVMSNRQQPDHTRIRKYTRDGFSGKRMQALEPYIRRRSSELAGAMIKNGGPIDFVKAFGHPLPGQTIFRFIGFDESDDDQIMAWTGNRLAFTWGKPSEAEQVAIAEKMLSYWRYCRAFVADRFKNRQDDLTSELLNAHEADPEEISYREIESIIYGHSFAGHEIVSNFLSNALLALLPRRDVWDALCQDASLIPNALEEVLRFDSPQTSWRRITNVDTQFAGVQIPAGTQVFLSLGAANHDPDVFANPTQFDVQRKNARKHIAFGHGIHFCLGARLARLEGQIALETLTQQLPDLRLVENQSLQYSGNITFRGPTELFVDWN
jgi:cytochrome P450